MVLTSIKNTVSQVINDIETKQTGRYSALFILGITYIGAVYARAMLGACYFIVLYYIFPMAFIFVVQDKIKPFTYSLNIRKIIYLALAIILLHFAMFVLLAPFVGMDPQNLTEQPKINMFTLFFTIPVHFFVGLSEELFKVCFLLALYHFSPKGWRSLITVALAVSVIFGTIHLPVWGWRCVIPLCLCAMIDFLFLFRYRCFLLLVIAHMLNNSATSLLFIEKYGVPLFEGFLVLAAVYVAYPFLGKTSFHKNFTS